MSLFSFISTRWQEYNFLFEELVKRDLKKRYKRTILGIFWSLLGPLLQLLVMYLVFTQFFGRTTPHFIVYVFSGLLIFNCFSVSTNAGMLSLIMNAGIISKTNAPKYLFLFSSNISNLINFGLSLVIFFIFVAADGIPFHFRFLLLIYPVVCLLIFNIGVGLILSALYLFFRDMQYLYGIFTMLLMWLSAIFYPVDIFSLNVQRLFTLNPIFTFIHYFRLVIIHGTVPSLNLHLIAGFHASIVLVIGCWMYRKYNYRFVYYM